MASSIALQLQALKSFIQTEPEQTRRPFTRPSIIYDPKQAADTDIDTIFTVAQSGLDALEQKDIRFGGYKKSLFSPKSKDSDRELMGIEENKRINESIASYLRLLSGELVLLSALKTLEYLIRRYKVHVYNVDELILCALPYHDTTTFVRIVHLLQLGNSKWYFLEGVKLSGAPPPRKVIVQQCMRDMGVLDALCEYASPRKKNQPSLPVVNFFTAVIVEVLGALPTIDTNTVRRILPFVFSGLEPTSKGGANHKAGALMIVGVLASRSTLAPKLVRALIESIARVARQDATELEDLPWLRRSLMAIINLVQSQSVQTFPRKALELLKDIRDFAGVLSGLSKEFNGNKFLSVYLESLASYSSCDSLCRHSLVSIIETVPVKDFIYSIVYKVLTSYMMSSRIADNSKQCESGWAKEIFATVRKCYPSELRKAVRKLEDSKVNSLKEDSMLEVLCIMFDESKSSPDIADLEIWFSLEHPKAEVRRATLSNLAPSGVLKANAFDSQKLASIQEAMLRRLYDEDLSVAQAALSLDGLSEFISAPDLLKAYWTILQRFIDVVMTGPSLGRYDVCEVAISCLDSAILNLQDHYLKEVAKMMFPLILIIPKTWRVNVKALGLTKDLQWPFYNSISSSYDMVSQIQEKVVNFVVNLV
ncbi:hypothetical protein GIB67_008614 [Kingdonia uniflora]|uniref:U3 small nucleolar RNA-associated protein 10 N-terminal domain-containing protein n=1 Tax=Kingdonia uniflora TaxID=39325 RepID=A0A7J7M4V2_9MAGN|nr:hypothetical protein GIB67_008614 [Kingdonia uniflora]